MTTQYCKGGARTAWASRRAQRSARQRSARRSYAGSRPSTPGKGAPSPGVRGAGWAEMWPRSTWRPRGAG
eukprot:8324295-Alexandrium_andersonii.AAC.1